jgi:hypothetical protein
MPHQQVRGAQLNSSASPLPAVSNCAQFPLPAGSAKMYHGFDFTQILEVLRVFFDAETQFFLVGSGMRSDRSRSDRAPGVACDTGHADPVWCGLRSLEIQSAALPAIEQGFDLPPGCVTIAGRARWSG